MAESQKQSDTKSEEEDSSLILTKENSVVCTVKGMILLGYVLGLWVQSRDYLYHYTTRENADSILKDQCIRISTNKDGDVYYGAGVYLTSLHPKQGKEKILKAIYDKGKKIPERRKDHANYFFGFKKTFLSDAEKKNSERDIWLFPRDIHFKKEDIHSGEMDVWVLKHGEFMKLSMMNTS